MLEQELQNQEVEHPNSFQQISPELELFEQYEIKNWNFSPRLYKIMAASAIFNLVALVVFAQTNLLTRKGCESPLVGRVCDVIDAVYVGKVLLGEDKEFASVDYEKTKLEDFDITYVDVSGQTPPLKYPEGYFALANPESVMPDVTDTSVVPSGFEMPPAGSTSIPGITNNPIATNPIAGNPIPGGNNMLNKPAKLPPPMKGPAIKGGKLPKGPLGDFVADDKPEKNKAKDKTLDDKQTAENKDEKDQTTPKQLDLKSMPVAEKIINKKPLQDFGETVLDKVAAKTVDLNKPFMVVMQGTITKEGKFDPNKSGYTKQDGDPEMINVAKDAIEAIGDSGILTYLSSLEVENVSFTLVQDDKQIYAIITSDQKTENQAKKISSGLNFFISTGKMTVKEEDTLALLNASKVESQGKNFVLNFKLDKPIAQELIKRQLEKAQAKRQQQPQPSGNVDSKNANLNAVKK